MSIMVLWLGAFVRLGSFWLGSLGSAWARLAGRVGSRRVGDVRNLDPAN
jgi:lauroyl/myristoyl acyltransferase